MNEMEQSQLKKTTQRKVYERTFEFSKGPFAVKQKGLIETFKIK